MSEIRNDKFYDSGLKFSCAFCHRCCRHDAGYVFFTEDELMAMSSYLGVTAEDFREKYCRTVRWGSADRLSLREKENYDCVFWENGCSIYPARPLQCAAYPFWPQNLSSAEDWENESALCPGMNQGSHYSRNQIEELLEALANRRLLFR